MKTGFNRVLVPVDFSAGTQDIIGYADIFAEKFGARIKLVHVVESAPFEIHRSWNAMIPPPPGAKERETTAMAGGKLLLRNAVETAKEKLDFLAGKEGKYQVIVRTGPIVGELLAESNVFKPDLIVMGTQGLTGLKHLVLGSIAEKMVRLSRVPVLTWRIPGE